MDMYLEWGGDLVLTPNGSIQTAVAWDAVRERIIRRFLTNSAQQLPDGSFTAPDYIFDIRYGLGAGALVDQNPTRAWEMDLKRRIRQAVLSDSAVDPGSVPRVLIVGLGSNTIQVFVQVKLISGATGKVSITVAGTQVAQNGAGTGSGGTGTPPEGAQIITDDFGNFLTDDEGNPITT